MYKIVFFDLDGTLTDSGTGIMNSVAYALKKFGIEEWDETKLRKFVGPPLIGSFRKYYGFSEADARQAVQAYREYCAEKGIGQNEVYPGIEAFLQQVRSSGRRLVIATAKPEKFARMVLDNFGLTQYFDLLVGASMDETRTKKAEVIAYALKKIETQNLAEIVMVGDREDDILWAIANGLDSIGVLYGYGDQEELQEAGATYLAEKVGDISKFL